MVDFRGRPFDVVRLRIRCVIETFLSICHYFSTRTQFDPNTLAMVYCESVVFVAVALHELHLAGFIVTLSHLSRVSCELVSFLAAVSCLMSPLSHVSCLITCRYPLLIKRGVSPENMAALIYLAQQEGGKKKAIGAF